MAQLKSTNITGNLSVTGNVLASKIIKFGGTADEILLANGNVITKAQLQSAITNNTWRPVKYSSTTLNDSSTTLEFEAGSNIGLTFTNGKLTIANNYSYSLPLAANGTRGGIQIGYTASGANLPVQLSGEKAYVALTKAAVESVVTIPTIPGITITDTDKTNKIVGGITASGHTITVSRIGLSDLGLASVYKYKNTLDNLAAIKAVSNPAIGDVYNAKDTGMNYAWTGTEWDALGSTVDLSNYVTGSGTANYIPKFTATGAIGNSVITQSNNNDVTVAGKLIVQSNGSTSGNSYNEGIRVLPASNGWSELFFSNNQTTSSTHANGWILGKRGAAGTTSGAAGDFTIECNGSNGTGLTLYANGNRPRWNNNELAYLSDFGNANLPLRLQTYTTADNMPGIEADEATEQGWYYISRGDTNRPPFKNVIDIDSGTDYRIMSTAHSDNWVQQLATNFRSNDIFIRRKQSGTWQGWTSLVKMEEGLTNPTGTTNAIPRWEGTKNSTLKNSGVTIDDNNNLTTPGSITTTGLTTTSTLYVTGTTGHREGIRIAPYGNLSSIWWNATGIQDYTTGQMWGITAYDKSYTGDTTKTNTFRFRGPASATATSATDQMWINTSGLVTSRGGFAKSGSSNEYVLLAGGETKALSDFGLSNNTSFNPADYVTLTGTETISGVKTFTAQPVINTVNGLKFDSGNCKLRIYNTSASPTDYAAIEVRSNSASTNRNLFIDLSNNSLVVGAASGTADTTYKVNVKDTFNATTIYENGTSLSEKYQSKDADLTSIAGLTGTSGFLKKTAANTWSLDTNTYVNTSTLNAAISGTANQLAYFTNGTEIRSSANTKVDSTGNITAVSYGIYTDVANNKAAKWQYNSSTDCVELVW